MILKLCGKVGVLVNTTGLLSIPSFPRYSKLPECIPRGSRASPITCARRDFSHCKRGRKRAERSVDDYFSNACTSLHDHSSLCRNTVSRRQIYLLLVHEKSGVHSERCSVRLAFFSSSPKTRTIIHYINTHTPTVIVRVQN